MYLLDLDAARQLSLFEDLVKNFDVLRASKKINVS